METKYKVLAAIFLLGLAFGMGRFTTPVKIKTVMQTTEVQKMQEQTKTDTDRDKHRETTTTEVVHPDGTKETTTKVVEDTQTKRKTDSKESEQINVETTQTKEVTRSSSPVTVSALGGVTFAGSIPATVFGASVSKPVIGPVTIGVWGLTDRTFGASIGLTF